MVLNWSKNKDNGTATALRAVSHSSSIKQPLTAQSINTLVRSAVAVRAKKMDITKHINSGILKVIVKPNAPKTQILAYDENKQALRIAVAAVPDKSKANTELLKFLKKQTGQRCEIARGSKSKEKLIRFLEL
jgi:uncharacterized protein (TIGR00251 family)